MRCIIAGSRNLPFCPYRTQLQILRPAVLAFEQKHGKITEVVSGTAKGADLLGEAFAEMRKIPVDRYPADWITYGKRAGFIRNSQMANEADGCIALWDMQSKGTKNMIELASNKKLHIIVYNILTNTEVVVY